MYISLRVLIYYPLSNTRVLMKEEIYILSSETLINYAVKNCLKKSHVCFCTCKNSTVFNINLQKCTAKAWEEP